ncbi:MAG: extracellular solute-binding protein [Oscillospiraceae bacterium]|jgi:tungstate transport system substrate-binding protein|nr:extracellular solute-binding protein [Oscillospiraceae bacterium]
MKKIAMSLTVLFILSISLAVFVGCDNSGNEEKTIILATTTSTYDSGLLDYILPAFTEETGIDVQVISVGTGAAIQLGRDGEADVVLVHDRVQEDAFVADGFAETRYDVMYNDFVVVGPSDGEINHNINVGNTFTSIFDNELTFISRGDNSGTHSRELLLWNNLSLNPADNPNYLEAGQGMGATIGMTAEMEGYTLSDRATWLSYASKGDLIIVCENDPTLLNPYGVMVVSSTLRPNNSKQFVDWLRGSKAQSLIAEFGVEEFGEPLFFPDA